MSGLVNQIRQYGHQAARTNPVGIQMLSEVLHNQIFGDDKHKLASNSDEILNNVRDHLKKHGLMDKVNEMLPNVEFQLPPMQGTR